MPETGAPAPAGSEPKIRWVDPDRIALVWPRIAPLVLKLEAETGGEHTMASVLRSALAAETTLVVAHDETTDEILGLVGIRGIADGSGRSVLVILWAVGSQADRWAPSVIETLSDWGERNGFHSIKTIGRKGWARRALEGFTVTRWVYEKRLGVPRWVS